MDWSGARALVPMAHVADMARSIRFYEALGFRVESQVPREEEAEPVWVWLSSGGAQLMLARASAPVVAEEQAVLFYTYCDDVAEAHAALAEAGLEPGPVAKPFYNPGGEFRLVDPDGYVVYVAQT